MQALQPTVLTQTLAKVQRGCNLLIVPEEHETYQRARLNAAIREVDPDGLYLLILKKKDEALFPAAPLTVKAAEVLLSLTQLVEEEYIVRLDKMLQETPNLQFLTVDLRVVDLTSVIITDDRLMLLTDHIFWRFKQLVAIRYATNCQQLQNLLKEMTDRAKLQKGRVSVHGMQQVPNQWDIDLATELA